MGYDVLLVAKTRDEEKSFRILDCNQAKGDYFLSRSFSMFQSRNFEGCELNQVENILDIDLSIYWNYPVNFFADTGELEYRLSLAEEANNFEKATGLQHIEAVERHWRQNYDQINEGWTKVEDLRKVTLYLINKIKENPHFGQQMQIAPGWEYSWNKYFTLMPKKNSRDERLIDDLEKILSTLDCIEQEGEKYVAFIGA
jgi:hypothetical protein